MMTTVKQKKIVSFFSGSGVGNAFFKKSLPLCACIHYWRCYCKTSSTI